MTQGNGGQRPPRGGVAPMLLDQKAQSSSNIAAELPVSGYEGDEAPSSMVNAASGMLADSAPQIPAYDNSQVAPATSTSQNLRKSKKGQLAESKSNTKILSESRQQQYINEQMLNIQ